MKSVSGGNPDGDVVAIGMRSMCGERATHCTSAHLLLQEASAVPLLRLATLQPNSAGLRTPAGGAIAVAFASVYAGQPRANCMPAGRVYAQTAAEKADTDQCEVPPAVPLLPVQSRLTDNTRDRVPRVLIAQFAGEGPIHRASGSKAVAECKSYSHIPNDVWVDECPLVFINEVFAAHALACGFVPVAFRGGGYLVPCCVVDRPDGWLAADVAGVLAGEGHRGCDAVFVGHGVCSDAGGGVRRTVVAASEGQGWVGGEMSEGGGGMGA